MLKMVTAQIISSQKERTSNLSTMKIFSTSVALFCLCFVFASTVLADAKVSANTPPNSLSSKPSVPKRVLGAFVGTVVGTPICFVRRAAWDEKEGVRGIIGDTNNKVAVVAAGAFWLPFSVVTGFLEAPCYAFKQSMCNTDKPFSCEQFSLGKDVE